MFHLVLENISNSFLVINNKRLLTTLTELPVVCISKEHNLFIDMLVKYFCHLRLAAGFPDILSWIS